MIGRTVSHYEVVEHLGAGGMGTVYGARDTVLHRAVALKVMPTESSSDAGRRRRFLREARAASALNHPGIITIHDVLRDEDSDIIVMERVDGEPLYSLIPEGGLPLHQAVEWGAQIAEAVAAAHRAGVIHRDLKPGNVMITRDGRVKVLDFGLAKVEFAAPDAPTQTQHAPLTQHGALLGTLQYMAPEQALGEAVDSRADVFSFGAVLYEMLAGKRAFEAPSTPSLIHKVAYGDPQLIAECRPEIPPQLGQIVTRALAKKPEDRFQSMEDLAEQLRELRTPSTARTAVYRPASQPSEPRSGPLRSFLGGRRLAVAAAVLGVLALGGYLASRQGGWVLLRGDDAARREQASRTAAADVEALQPFELYQQAHHLLERWDKEGQVDLAIDYLQRAAAKKSDYAPAYAGLGLAYWRKYRIEKDPLWLERGLNNARHAVDLDPQLTAARAIHGLVLVERGESGRAREELEEVLALDPANVLAYHALAELEERSGNPAQAESLFRQALDLEPENWNLHAKLGYLLYIQGEYEAAESSFRRGLELTPDNFNVYTRLAAAQHMQGRYSEAADSLQKALSIRADAGVYSNLGTLYFFQGLFQQSAAAFERAVDLGPNKYTRWANLGDAYRAIPGREGKATEAYRRAIQLVDEDLAAAPEDVTVLSRRALYLAKGGETSAALVDLARLQQASDLDSATHYRVALAYEIAEHRDAALEALQRALEAGYSLTEIKNEPDLAGLRADARYHQLALRFEELQS